MGTTAQNVLEVARFGGLQTDEASAPYEAVDRRRVHRLRRHFPERAGTARPAVLLVPPLMLSAEVYDVSAGCDRGSRRAPGRGAGCSTGGDSWLSTETLFRRDEDGDHWLVDSVPALVRTAEGTMAPLTYANALAELRCVDLVVGYGVAGPDGFEVPVAALTLLDGESLRGDDPTGALAHLEPARRPTVVQVVGGLPTTAWYRPLPGPLREAGIPVSTRARPVWVRSGGSYRTLTKAARAGVVGDG